MLFFEDPSGADQKIGTAKTNKMGKFEIEELLFAGSYYVKVAKKSVSTRRGVGASGKTTCKSKKSKSKKG